MIIDPKEYAIIYYDYIRTPKRRALKKEYGQYGFSSFMSYKTEERSHYELLWTYVAQVVDMNNLPEYPWVFILNQKRHDCYFFTKDEFDKFVVDFKVPASKLPKEFDKCEDLPTELPYEIFLWGSVFKGNLAVKSRTITTLGNNTGINVKACGSWRSTVINYFCRKTQFTHSQIGDYDNCPICELSYHGTDKKYYVFSDELILYLEGLSGKQL